MSAPRLPLLAVLVSTIALGLACGSPWKVVTTSGSPSALKGKMTYTVTADYKDTKIGEKTESQYLAEKDEETRGKFAGDKTGMHEDLVKALARNKSGVTFGDTGDVALTVHYNFIEPGVYTAVFNMPTTVTVRADFAVGGNVVDSIDITASQQSDIYHPSSGQRMRNCADTLGNYINMFIAGANK